MLLLGFSFSLSLFLSLSRRAEHAEPQIVLARFSYVINPGTEFSNLWNCCEKKLCAHVRETRVTRDAHGEHDARIRKYELLHLSLTRDHNATVRDIGGMKHEG